MYNLTQFVLKFLISFLLVFSLYVFIVYLHLLKFVKFVKKFLKILILLTCISIYISTIIFLASLDNDRSTVETSYFTVDFYRYTSLEQKIIFQIGTLNPHGINERFSFG